METLGNTLTFKVPSGFEVTIREQDGEDDDIISKMKNSQDGSSISKFVSSILLGTSLTKGRPTPNDIQVWKNRDKYHVLLKSRIFSLGSEILYKHKCTACKKETNYEEDLKPYDRDFSKSPEDSDNGFKFQIQPYINGEALEAELTLQSGKRIKYKYLNGLSEKKLLDFPKDDMSKNTELLLRGIEWFYQDRWQKIENFKVFSARDMKEIRTHVEKHDLPFEAASECTCPFCENVDTISLITQPDFFFPRGI